MAIDSSIEHLHNQILKTENEYTNKKGECKNEAEGWFMGYIAIFIFFILPIIAYISTHNIWWTLLIFIIGWVICGFIGMILDAIFEESIYISILKKHKKTYEDEKYSLNKMLSETQKTKSQLRFTEQTINMKDAEQYENFLRKKYV